MIPDNSKKKLEQLRQEMALRAQLQQQYDKEMSGRYNRDMIPFTQWMDQRNKGMAKGGKALPSAESDANLAKFLKDAASKDRMYHATGDDFKVFDPEKSSEEGKFGKGIYMTPQPRYANFFAGIRGKQGKSAQIMPVHTSIKNPYKIQGHQNIPFNKIDQNKLKELGHDGIFYYDDSGDLKEAVAFHPTQVKSAIGNRGTYDVNDPDITKAEGGKVEPTQDEMRLALSKTKRHGMYSPLERLAIDIPRNKGTGAEFMAEISKQKGFKPEEVADRKIPIPEGKMTKAEFVKHLQAHSNTPLREDIRHGMDEDQREERFRELMEHHGYESMRELDHRARQKFNEQINAEAAQYDDPSYNLPGGKNYREILLSLPERKPNPKNYTDPAKYDADLRAHNESDSKDFQSSHWQGDPNVLMHMRLSDRTGPKGEKLLHLEELQSDWHQHGRRFGYARPRDEVLKEMREQNERQLEQHEKSIKEQKKALFDELKTIKDQLRGMPSGPSDAGAQMRARELDIMKQFRALDEIPEPEPIRVTNNGVPQAPFKKSWHELGMKHVLHHAAKHGYQGVVVTPGEEQTRRWKDEGLKVHYDKKIPEFLNKFGKPHGVQLQMYAHKIKGGPDDYGNASENLGLAHIPMNELTPEQNSIIANQADKTLHYFPITEPMRTSILKEGMPQYVSGGVVHKAQGGAVLPIEQIKAQMMNRFKGLSTLQSIGADEAPSLGVKAYVPTVGRPDNGQMPVGGVDTQQGDLPVGGIDMNNMQQGQQLMPNQPSPAGQQPGMDQVPAGDKINTMDGTGMPPNPNANPNQMGSNILSMTPQGQAMAAMKPQGLKKGGNVSIDQMKDELSNRKRPLCMTDDHGYADGGHVFEEAEKPKQTVKAYKLFRTEKKHPGKLFPLFVDANTPVEMGKWLAAKEGEMRGSKVKSKIGDLAYRPGWHAGDLPVATHIGEKSHPSLTAPDTRPEHHVWAEVEMPHDVDWQSEANKRGTNSKGNIVPVKAHITDQIPHGGHYRYKTNSNMTGNWLIGGAMKVNRVLTDAEVKKINKAAKTADLPRAKPLNLAKHGFAQGGSTKGYVVHTPKKPHAEVGQRFTSTPQGNLVAPQQFDIMKHEGKGSIVPIPYDATTRDKLVSEVSGHQLNEPLMTEAGFDYSMDPTHMAQNIGGASNLGIAGRVQKRIDQAAKEHGGDVFLAPNTMSEDAENFSHHPAHIVLDLMKQRQLNKKTLKALSDDLRSQFEYVKTPNGTQKVFPYKNFLGFDHPNMMEQVMKGGHGLDTTSGNLRKKLMERLGQVNVQKLLDYNLGDLKAAILDPDIASDPKAYMGRTLVKAQAGAPLRLSRHKSYDTDYTGTYAGGLGGNRPLEIMMPDVYSDIEKELLQRPAKVVKTPAQHRAQVVGALEKRKEKFAQPINARVINNAGLYEEGLRQGEFDPKNVDSVLAYFKRKGGYKAGGKVKLHTDQDTMQLALTKKSKKAK